jgi:hypothetical protein
VVESSESILWLNGRVELVNDVTVNIVRILAVNSSGRVPCQISKGADVVVDATAIGDRVVAVDAEEQATVDHSGLDLEDRDASLVLEQLAGKVERRVDKCLCGESFSLQLRISPAKGVSLVEDLECDFGLDIDGDINATLRLGRKKNCTCEVWEMIRQSV